MTKRRLYVVIAASAVLACIGVGTFAALRSDKPHASLPAASTGDAQGAAAALSKLVASPSTLVASSSRLRVDGHARQGVPLGSKVTTNVASWMPDGLGGGVMQVTITAPGQASVTYAAIMVHEPDGWKVLETIPIP